MMLPRSDIYLQPRTLWGRRTSLADSVAVLALKYKSLMPVTLCSLLQLLVAKTAEITALRRTARRDAAEIRRLGAAKSRAEGVGKRHLEELALLRRLQRQKVCYCT